MLQRHGYGGLEKLSNWAEGVTGQTDDDRSPETLLPILAKKAFFCFCPLISVPVLVVIEIQDSRGEFLMLVVNRYFQLIEVHIIILAAVMELCDTVGGLAIGRVTVKGSCFIFPDRFQPFFRSGALQTGKGFLHFFFCVIKVG